jgi:hypothetical protein
MDYCGPRGIPLSVFLDWDQQDQDNALMWQAHEARRYPDGTHPDDWDEDTGGSRRAYHVHIDTHPGARLIEKAMYSPEFKEAGEGAHVHLVRGEPLQCERCAPKDQQD